MPDDQTALLGCAAALLLCGVVMWASYFVGRFVRGSSARREVGPTTLPFASHEQTARVSDQRADRRVA